MTTGWDELKPAASTSLRLSNPEILTNQTAIEGFSGADHVGLEINDATVGKHKVARLIDQASDPATVTGDIALYNNGNALFARLQNSGRIIPIDSSHLTETKSSAYTAVKADIGKVLLVSGATTITLTAAATLGNGWFVYIKKTDASNVVTIDPDGIEEIDGSTTVTLVAQQEMIVIVCDGGNFYIIGIVNEQHDHSDTANGGDLGQVSATDITVTGSAASTPDANTLTKDQMLGARCQFNGSGTPAFISGSVINFDEVAGIVDNGTGNWILSYERDFAVATYSWFGTGSDSNGTVIYGSTTETKVGSIQVFSKDVNGAARDDTLIMIAAFGPQ